MTSPVRDVLEAYVAGRVNAERLVITVTSAYYGRDGGRGTRDGLGPVIEVIDRASPGIVELGTVQGGAGFEVRLAERPFPKQWEGELRRAAEAVLHAGERPGKGESRATVMGRIIAAVRRLFTASA
ncbi:MAG: hypothetical protein DMD46_03770 [Gemmatimonadetes bacterium]|nr:MAG: hypothetical protein DMD46_03770 [Gemmatimonadota bacterium]